MIRFAADENLNDLSDPAILEWAAAGGRVVLTHDVSTVTKHAYDRVRAGKRVAGIFEIGHTVPVALAIEETVLMAECSLDGEWEGQVRYLPLRQIWLRSLATRRHTSRLARLSRWNSASALRIYARPRERLDCVGLRLVDQ